jgi:hypothetical protein
LAGRVAQISCLGPLSKSKIARVISLPVSRSPAVARSTIFKATRSVNTSPLRRQSLAQKTKPDETVIWLQGQGAIACPSFCADCPDVVKIELAAEIIAALLWAYGKNHFFEESWVFAMSMVERSLKSSKNTVFIRPAAIPAAFASTPEGQAARLVGPDGHSSAPTTMTLHTTGFLRRRHAGNTRPTRSAVNDLF